MTLFLTALGVSLALLLASTAWMFYALTVGIERAARYPMVLAVPGLFAVAFGPLFVVFFGAVLALTAVTA